MPKLGSGRWQDLDQKEKRRDRAFEMLHEIIEDAIQLGADSVELVYVVEGLEVTYFFGHSGKNEIGIHAGFCTGVGLSWQVLQDNRCGI